MAKATLGVILETISGKAGNLVFVDHPQGTHVRARVTPTDPRSPAQIEHRNRLARANAAWKRLTDPEFEAWQAAYAPRAAQAFNGLALRFLHLNPDAPIPTLPPADPLSPDPLTLEATVTPEGIHIESSDENGEDVATEFLTQRLPNPRRRAYATAWRHAAYKQFTKRSKDLDLPLAPGIYALAYRFQRISTGQTTPLVGLGTLTVG